MTAARISFDCQAGGLAGAIAVPVIVKADHPEHGVGLVDRVIEFQRAQGRFPRLGHGLVRSAMKARKLRVSVRQLRMRRCVSRVEDNRLFKQADGFHQFLRRPLVHQDAPLEKQPMRFRIGAPLRRQQRLRKRLPEMELRLIAAAGNLNEARVAPPFDLVVASQSRPQPAGLHPDNCVGSRVERGAALENLEAQRIFLEGLAFLSERVTAGTSRWRESVELLPNFRGLNQGRVALVHGASSICHFRAKSFYSFDEITGSQLGGKSLLSG